jgi:hypothetical protein
MTAERTVCRRPGSAHFHGKTVKSLTIGDFDTI